jgi:acyl carrier protein
VTVPTEAAILTDVRDFVVKEFLYMRPNFTLGDDDSLLKSGVVDSMGVLEVLNHLEEKFGVRPEDDEITEANLGTLRAIARFVVAKSG